MLTALFLFSLLGGASAQQLFHGTSLIVTANDLVPSNATFESASFYCYATPQGYVSFGWWTGGGPEDIDLTPISPRPGLDDMGWFEYSTGSCSSRGVCELEAINFNGSNPDAPAFVEDYTIIPYQLGPTERELMYLSYFNREHGKTAVGVRQLLQRDECGHAYETLANLVSRRKLPIRFNMQNPCSGNGVWEGGVYSSQTVLAEFAKHWGG